MSILGAAIIGVGRIGRTHFSNLSQFSDVDIRWLVDAEEIRPQLEDVIATLVLRNKPSIRSPDQLDEVLSDDKLVYLVWIQ